MPAAASLRLHVSAPGGTGSAWLSLLLGAGITLVIFQGLARFDRQEAAEAPPEFQDLRAVSLQEPPPPPRETPLEPVRLATALTGFEAAQTDSPVQIAIPPPDVAALLPPPPVAPPAVIQLGQLHAELKPRMDLGDLGNRIYQMAEVDRVPEVLRRVTPTIPANVRDGAAQLRASLVFVVDANGDIRNVRLASSSGNAEFDAIVLANIKEWTFAPAVRQGKKVRCLLQQAVIIKWSSRSRFEL